MKVADALSRHPVVSQEDDIKFDGVEEAARAYATVKGDGIESVTWRRVNEAAGLDEECAALCQLIIDGFPSRKSALPHELQLYWGMKDELYIIENVPFKGHKMLVPKCLRPQVLEGLHAANQGVTGMLSNARDHFFWPGLDAAVRQIRLQCRQCNENAPSQHSEPPVITPPPDVPFQQTAADLFDLEGHSFLAFADRLSGWLEVERLTSTSFAKVRPALLRWFSTFGVPEEIATDGGSPFKGSEFLKKWDVGWRNSSAYYPQSNGRAEAAVKSAKRILTGNINSATGALDTDAAARALMTHRNTPSQDTGISPAVVLFGRNLRDHLPRVNRKLRPEWGLIADSREQALAKRALKGIDKGKELMPLGVGDSVQIQNQHGNHPGKWYNTGVISAALPHRQYHVIVDGSRRVTLRNRRFLKKILPISRKEPGASIDPAPIPLPIDSVEQPNNVQQDILLTTSTHLPSNENPPDLLQRHHDSDYMTNPAPCLHDEGLIDNAPDNTLPPGPNEELRRSTRIKVPWKPFSVKMKGKYHE